MSPADSDDPVSDSPPTARDVAVSSLPNDPAPLLSLVSAAFSEHGALARVLEGYEPRPGQRAMAEAVADVIATGGTLLAEAGTGTGKTLAYLVPALLSGHRVLVSTGTKNLQEQIFFKDLPALERALPRRFTATLMKGRSNYLCLHRWELYRDGVGGNTSAGGRLIETGDRVFVPIVQKWLASTQTGDRAELRELPEDVPIWKDIAANAETCLGKECPRYGDCFVTLMRQRAAESDVVIVNHHLLCADAAVRQSDYGEVIPSCSMLVVDEAHQLEDVATQYFGVSLSHVRVDDFVRDVTRLIAAGALGARSEEVQRDLERIADHARLFFGALSSARAAGVTGETRSRYTASTIADHIEHGLILGGALDGLEATLALAATGTSTDRASDSAARDGSERADAADTREAVGALERRAGELRSDLRFVLRADDPDFVYFLESRGRALVLRASPIHVARLVQETLFARMRTVVLTSATLTVGDSFDYVKRRLGVRSAQELRVPSEFDYANQALVYLPRRMPSPKSPSFGEAAAREVVHLLERSRGRAFVLFTSYSVLRTVQQFVQMSLPYPLFVQGTAPRSALIEQFRATPHAVLLATSSFWQGVDVVGEALSCVIIDKLPFASPGDPITAARIEAIASEGGDAFSSYQIPLAILTLQQGLGRLIRHRNDRGVLAILDPRLKSMAYGRRFLDSLPPAPRTHDLGAVQRFFG